MMEPPKSADDSFFFEASSNAALRIQHMLKARGEWRDEYAPILILTGAWCARYLRLAKMDAHAPVVEQARLTARRGLEECGYIPAGRFHLGALNSDGLDSDIAEVCSPISEVE